MNFPLQIAFKRLALSPQIRVTDSGGRLTHYVRQKLFKLRESVTVFADEAQSRPIFRVDADRVIDFNAAYRIADAGGRPIGAVRRRGLRSLWRAHYEIQGADGELLTVSEENPWIKVLDGFLSEIPIIGLFAGYWLHPAYLVTDRAGRLAARVQKTPALTESRYRIDEHQPLQGDARDAMLVGIFMMLLLERTRG
ncbi:MAG: hypothetical protein ACK5VV_06400 [Lysobacteraceae bacterium]